MPGFVLRTEKGGKDNSLYPNRVFILVKSKGNKNEQINK